VWAAKTKESKGEEEAGADRVYDEAWRRAWDEHDLAQPASLRMRWPVRASGHDGADGWQTAQNERPPCRIPCDGLLKIRARQGASVA
jgi:hypothetical protein